MGMHLHRMKKAVVFLILTVQINQLYFTSHCVIECMHVHASDRKLTESGSAKFFVRENGDTVLQNRGILNDREIRIIQGFIK